MTEKKLIENESWIGKLAILVPFVTLLMSTHHYISNFIWGGGATSFKLGQIIWPLCIVVGVLVFLTSLKAKYSFTNVFAAYVIYYSIGALLSPTLTKDEVINECIYTLLFFALIVLFMNNSSKYGISNFFRYGICLILPLAFFAYQALIDEYNVSASKTYNTVYYFVYYLPFAFFEKKNSIRIFEIGIIFVAVILSNKRTAFIVLIVSAIYYFYRMNKEATQKKRSKIGVLLFTIVIGIAVYYIFTQVMADNTNINWQNRFEALEGGSGRSERYQQFFKDMKDANLFQIVFGHGVAYPLYHNDLMQVIYNSGIIGASFYIVMCVQLVLMYKEMNKKKYRFMTSYGIYLIIFFLNSAVGQVIVLHTWTLQIMVYWGLVFGDFYKESKLLCDKEGEKM